LLLKVMSRPPFLPYYSEAEQGEAVRATL